MPKALRIILVVQVLLGAIWTLAMLTEMQKSLASLTLFVLIYPFHLIFFFVALWAIWKHPDLRRRAIWVIVLPVGFLFLPYLITSFFGSPLHAGQLAGLAFAAVVFGLVLGVAAPKKAVKVLPSGAFRSRGFNILIIGGIVLAWLFPVVALTWLSQQGGTSTTGGGQGSPGMGTAMVILGVATYFVGVAAASLMAAVFGWIGLRGGVEGAQRKLHIAQLVIAAPGVLLGGVTLAWIISQAG